MAHPNNTVPSGTCCQEPELRQSSILIDGDENEKQHEVTLKEFVQFVEEKSEWLYQKIQAIHQKYDDCLETRDSQIAEEELRSQAKEGELIMTQKELQEVRMQLAQAEQAWDIFVNTVA